MYDAPRPMSIFELLDRSIRLYKKNFFLLASIAMLPPLLEALGDAVPSLVFKAIANGGIPQSLTGAHSLADAALAFLLISLYLAGLVLASGATVHAVSTVYLGRNTGVHDAYKAAFPFYSRLFGLFLIICLICVAVLIGLFVVVALISAISGVAIRTTSPANVTVLAVSIGISAVVGWIYVFVFMALSIPVCVLERANVPESIRRSVSLSRGARGSIWLLFLIRLALKLAVFLAVAISEEAGVLTLSPLTTALGKFGHLLLSALITPVLNICLVLLYYDQRVKKEDFDLQRIMKPLDAGFTVPTQGTRN
jgi:hypothetical protein